jgi:hypothetical protein
MLGHILPGSASIAAMLPTRTRNLDYRNMYYCQHARHGIGVEARPQIEIAIHSPTNSPTVSLRLILQSVPPRDRPTHIVPRSSAHWQNDPQPTSKTRRHQIPTPHTIDTIRQIPFMRHSQLVIPRPFLETMSPCLSCGGPRGGRAAPSERGNPVQGYLAHQKTPPPRTLLWAHV